MNNFKNMHRCSRPARGEASSRPMSTENTLSVIRRRGNAGAGLRDRRRRAAGRRGLGRPLWKTARRCLPRGSTHFPSTQPSPSWVFAREVRAEPTRGPAAALPLTGTRSGRARCTCRKGDRGRPRVRGREACALPPPHRPGRRGPVRGRGGSDGAGRRADTRAPDTRFTA